MIPRGRVVLPVIMSGLLLVVALILLLIGAPLRDWITYLVISASFLLTSIGVMRATQQTRQHGTTTGDAPKLQLRFVLIVMAVIPVATPLSFIILRDSFAVNRHYAAYLAAVIGTGLALAVGLYTRQYDSGQ